MFSRILNNTTAPSMQTIAMLAAMFCSRKLNGGSVLLWARGGKAPLTIAPAARIATESVIPAEILPSIPAE
jgi:hypothetical protein